MKKWVCTIGHTGHGKKTVTAMLHQVAKQSGKAEFGTNFEYATESNSYDHFVIEGDRPSRSPNWGMLRGAYGAVLVVSASDGPMPITRTHLKKAYEEGHTPNGVLPIIVFLNKTDLVDDEDLIEMVEMEVSELLNSEGFDGDNVTIIRGSALQAQQGDQEQLDKIKTLLSAMEKEFVP